MIAHIFTSFILIGSLMAVESDVDFHLSGIDNNMLTLFVVNRGNNEISLCCISSACPQIKLYDVIADTPLPLRADFPLITYATTKVTVKGNAFAKIQLPVSDLKWYYADVPKVVKVKICLDARNNQWMSTEFGNDPWVAIAEGIVNTDVIKYIAK